MITKTDAMTAQRFHEDGGRRRDGSCYVWRRSGQTKTWTTRPAEFRVPVKYGLRQSDYITELNADSFHTEAACPHGNR